MSIWIAEGFEHAVHRRHVTQTFPQQNHLQYQEFFLLAGECRHPGNGFAAFGAVAGGADRGFGCAARRIAFVLCNSGAGEYGQAEDQKKALDGIRPARHQVLQHLLAVFAAAVFLVLDPASILADGSYKKINKNKWLK